jgi:hypothetical protein
MTDYSGVIANARTGATFDYQVLTNHAVENQETQTLNGGSLGLTASVGRGGFFSDSLVKVDLLNLKRTSTTFDTYNSVFNPGLVNTVDVGCIFVGNDHDAKIPTTSNPQTKTAILAQSAPQQNFILANDAGYHFDLKSGYWIEPLVGFQYTYTTYGSNAADLGLADGQALRLHGGARVGVSKPVSDGGAWTGSLTGLLYSDVYVHGWVTSAGDFSSAPSFRIKVRLGSKASLPPISRCRMGFPLSLRFRGEEAMNIGASEASSVHATSFSRQLLLQLQSRRLRHRLRLRRHPKRRLGQDPLTGQAFM